MKHSFIRRQIEPLAGKNTSARRVIDDTSLDRLLQDCKALERGGKMDNKVALRHLQDYQLSGSIEELNAIVVGNIRLIVKCANRYQCPELPLGDLVVEGSIGFRTGLQKFDLSQADRGPVANYAMIWGRKDMLSYVDECARTVRIPRNVSSAAKKGLKELEKEVAKMEHGGISLDYILWRGDRPPSERIGALDWFGKDQNTERMHGEGYLEEDWNAVVNAGANERIYHPSIAGKVSTPPGCPTEAPQSRVDEEADMVYLACRALPDDTRRLVFGFFEMEDHSFSGECARLGLESSDAKVIVQRAISQLRLINGR